MRSGGTGSVGWCRRCALLASVPVAASSSFPRSSPGPLSIFARSRRAGRRARLTRSAAGGRSRRTATTFAVRSRWKECGGGGRNIRDIAAAADGVSLQEPLQDLAPAQDAAPQGVGEAPPGPEPSREEALQDLAHTQEALMVGLIATLAGDALQDTVAVLRRRLVEQGRHILAQEQRAAGSPVAFAQC